MLGLCTTTLRERQMFVSEEAELKRIGATPVPKSGRGLKKGDGLLGPFVVDVKEYSDSYSISRKAVAKLCKDSQTHMNHPEPLFVLALGAEGKVPVRMWAMSENMGMQMLEAWEEKYGNVQD